MKPREPLGPIQPSMSGLVGLLDLKGAEQSPNTLEGSIRATLGAEKYLTIGRRQYRRGSFTPGPGNSTGPLQSGIVVPQGEAWLLTGGEVRAIVGPGETLRGFAACVFPNAALAVDFYADGATVLGPLAPTVVGSQFPAAFTPGRVWSPGTGFGCHILEYLGAQVSFEILIELVRLPL